MKNVPDSKVHGANMGPIWGRQDPGGPHVSPMNFDIWGIYFYLRKCSDTTGTQVAINIPITVAQTYHMCGDLLFLHLLDNNYFTACQ